MFLLRRPTPETIRRFIASQSDLPFSYSQIGATRTEPPAGFIVDHNRIRIGSGQESYEQAVAALRSWKQFDLGWVSVVPPGLPVKVGTTVAVQAKTLGVWSLSACRIVYVIEEDDDVKKFGFAYGTLPDHVESGEERFTIEWRTDGSVWYDILAFSRPQHPLARRGRPLVRRWQKQFARDSLAAMLVASRP
ncbi:MAG: DUF1990 domain-containing protein [Pyrinomonadaceae bacterium]|nr:DUF1990 domain-containing protein [Pyrinomonadaceae bacterium]